MSKYKITISKNGIGPKAILWKKCWFFWLPDTIIQSTFDFQYSLNKDVEEWKEEFNIPDELVKDKR